MAKALRIVLVLAALSLAACGSSKDKNSSSPLSAPPSGSYTAKMTTPDLQKAGVVVLDVGNAGTWHMTLGPKRLSVKPPLKEAITYPVVSVTKDKLTLGPNPECSTAKGRSQKSVYTESQVSGGVEFKAVDVACHEDGGAITAGVWKKG
jgi:hypothetical protein